MYYYDCMIKLLHIYITIVFNVGMLCFISNIAVSVSLRAHKYVSSIRHPVN
jgi:hypothetical protein